MTKELIDYSKAKKIARAVINLKQQKKHPFDKNDLFPDAIIPKDVEEASQEHALFLFHAVSIDSMRQAEQVYSAMREVTQQVGSLIELTKMHKTDLERLLIPHFGKGIKTPKNSMTDPVGTLLHNSKILKETYENDPRKLKEGDIENTLKNIDRFKQYGIPKAALLMKNYVRYGIWPFSETEIPVKVDRHVMRINLGCKAIDIENHVETLHQNRNLSNALEKVKEQLIRLRYYTKEDFDEEKVRMIRTNKFIIPLTETYLKVTKKEGISAIDLDDAFWAIGANSCKRNNTIYCDIYCPIPCEIRNPSDNNAVYFFIDIDKRKHQNHLFKGLNKK